MLARPLLLVAGQAERRVFDVSMAVDWSCQSCRTVQLDSNTKVVVARILSCFTARLALNLWNMMLLQATCLKL